MAGTDRDLRLGRKLGESEKEKFLESEIPHGESGGREMSARWTNAASHESK
jgi:hypothetical protein